MSQAKDYKIIYFDPKVLSNIVLPERFTFPFYYEPHPLTILAAEQLQAYLENQTDFEHNFGLDARNNDAPIGKMFGVLVVKDTEGGVGYLAACSGKLAGSNHHSRLVPPVFDMLTEDSFFLQEQDVIDNINRLIEAAETDIHHKTLKDKLTQLQAQAKDELDNLKNELKDNKEIRRQRRETIALTPDCEDKESLEAELAKQSHYDRHRLRVLKEEWKQRVDEAKAMVIPLDERLEALKQERKDRSAALQQQLFDQYAFLNKAGEKRSLHSIFSQTAFGRPPAGAGECATPKLLQYALAHGYQPLAMAEFWWGAPPSSEIRQHKQYYPACAGKCKPILEHMLQDMTLDENPFLQQADESIQLSIVYEDEHLLVVNKPSGLRSVPGVTIYDSVYSRLKAILKDVEPLIVHRLDMGTSGLLVVAKHASVHKQLQRQFLDRTVHKRYTALLSKALPIAKGTIDLPLIPDPFNRPRQLVCTETGKTSITQWEVISNDGTYTKIHFWPQTGRTHQLRVHSAHHQGLNAPIVGDDIYGYPAERLYLHAGHLSFIHPRTKQRMSFDAPEEF